MQAGHCTNLPGDADLPPAATALPDWQPLPVRARSVFLAGSVPAFALPAAVVGGVVAANTDLLAPWLGALLLGLPGLVLGAWVGLKQYRHTYWKLDADGMAVRRGRTWQSETRVPATRVQHLDIKRGPLQRRLKLATLVVHTAGTRQSAVSVPNLDADDAERLRDRLSRQIDHGDDDHA